MEKKLISMTDENSILITARFIYKAERRKSEPYRPTGWYDIELIVKKDITCDQLMNAIRQGLRRKLIEIGKKRGVNAENIESKFIRNDIRKEEINEKIGEEIIAKSIEVRYVSEEDLTEDEIYIRCWNSFRKCIPFYNGISVTDIDYKGECICVDLLNIQSLQEGSELSVAHEKQIWLTEEKYGLMKLEDIGFVTSTKIIFDFTGYNTSVALFQDEDNKICKAFKENLPLYNISERPFLKLDDEPMEIIPPTEPPEKDKQNMLLTLLSPLLTMAAMSVARIFSGSGVSMLGMMIPMLCVSIFMTVLNARNRRREFQRSLSEWKEHYETYINRIILNIKDMQVWDVKKLQEIYPSKQGSKEQMGLVDMTLQIRGDIYSRGQEHPDFLAVRVGLSTEESQLVPSVFQIRGEKKDVVFTSVKYKISENSDRTSFSILMPQKTDMDIGDGYLIDLPATIANKYAHLHNAPILLRLKECVCLGAVFEDSGSGSQFIENFLLDLCFYHAPDDVQCVLFCESFQQTNSKKKGNNNLSEWEYQQQVIDKYKHLPHFRELLGDISAFAFNKEDANLILNKILELLVERKEAGEGAKFPHIVMIIQEEYDFKRHPVSQYLPEYEESENYGISFVFFKKYLEELPKYCGQVIRAKKNDEWLLLPHEQIISRDKEIQDKKDTRYSFKPDPEAPKYGDLDYAEEYEKFNRAYKVLSALYYHRIAQGADVPERVGLFPLLGVKEAECIGVLDNLKLEILKKIEEYWNLKKEKKPEYCEKRDVTKSLAVPVGFRAGDEIVDLDLHEKADGPHMLVAGTTGSGKTETILTYLIGLCTYYTPQQVNLLLIDMKGAGFVKRIGKLPHVVGTVTDVDGEENGTGMAYMLNRFLKSMASEVKRRKVLLSKMEVDSIDKYIEAQNDLDKHIAKLKLDETNSEDRKHIESMRTLPTLSHLFMVVDEFTELMRFSAENGDIDFKAEITSLARIGRSLGFHIILISQNIESAITDDIRVNSRARLCLKVATREASKEMIGTDLAASAHMPGNGRAYLLVGTGSRFEYFQSGYSGNGCVKSSEIPVLITQVEPSGRYSLFYDSEDYKVNSKNEVTQLEMMVEQIIKCADDNKIARPHQVFQQPLPMKCYYDYSWSKGTGECIILKKSEG